MDAKIKNRGFNLLEFYNLIGSLDVLLKENICTVCGWSEATFYRRIRSRKAFTMAEQKAIVQVCNNLKEKIIVELPIL